MTHCGGRNLWLVVLWLAVLGVAAIGNDFVETTPDEEKDIKGAPKRYHVKDDAMEKKREALKDVGRIAKDIKCTVCQQAAANISAKVALGFRDENLVLEWL